MDECCLFVYLSTYPLAQLSICLVYRTSLSEESDVAGVSVCVVVRGIAVTVAYRAFRSVQEVSKGLWRLSTHGAGSVETTRCLSPAWASSRHRGRKGKDSNQRPDLVDIKSDYS